MEKAIFAAGCFWGVQFYFDQVPGVRKTIVGYTGGETENPTYEDVCYRDTGHAEAVEIEFDPNTLPYETLVRHFFYMHNPTQSNRQGPDVGNQYRSAIFYTTETQKETAEAIKQEVSQELNNLIMTQITSARTFYIAEEYHQKYAEKTGRGMCHIPYKPM